MSFVQLILRSAAYHWRTNLSVALGVAAATAVLTGALLVGASMRASLSHLVLDGLAEIDEALLADRFFREELAGELAAAKGFSTEFDAAAPAIIFARAMVETRGEEVTRSADVTVIGADERFWNMSLDDGAAPPVPGEDEIILNAPLAAELGAKVGDEVTVRLSRSSSAPSESPLGRKTDLSESMVALTVTAVIEAEGLGRFSLLPSQRQPKNAYVALERMQDELDQADQVNTLFVSAPGAEPTSEEESQELSEIFQPRLADYGFQLNRVRQTYQPNGGDEETIFDYYSLSTDRMIFTPAEQRAIEEALDGLSAQPLFTYLSNWINRGSPQGDEPTHDGIPFSIITALDPTKQLGPYYSLDGGPIGELAEDEIVLNEWAAEDLSAEIGDTIRVTYFDPETVHGKTRERMAVFRLKAIVPLTKPDGEYQGAQPPTFSQRPTQANDPHLTPEVPGVTDQESIENWDPPFPFDDRDIRPVDEQYWERYRTTPKAFVSLETGRRLWGSRFGDTTSYRIPAQPGLAQQELADRLAAALNDHQAELGMAFRPIKRENLEAASGSTPFDVLFLAFSFFIIAAAVMLVALLFQLGIEQRASESGILLAVGLNRGQLGLAYVAEGLVLAVIGGLIGVAGGVGYAWLMLEGLKTLWLDAIVTPFLMLKIDWLSMAIGLVSGVVVSTLSIVWTVYRMRKIPLRSLMSGRAEQQAASRRAGRPWQSMVAAALMVGAAVLAVLATMSLSGEARAGAFLGSGAAVLAGCLLWLRQRLVRAGASESTSLTLGSLAMRNASRNPGRSTLTIGLVAAASFLIVAVSAFRLAPSEEGVGGFELMAQSNLPLFANPNTPQGRQEILPNDPELLEGAAMIPLRYKPGENASCLNVMQATRPQVLGVTPTMVEHFDRPDVVPFSWAATAAVTEEEKRNPWRLLEEPIEDGVVPVVLDKNTALYSLHLYEGVGQEFSVVYDADTRVRFRVVGLLSNTILQGSLMVSEENFESLFPRIGGYNFFLIGDAPPQDTAADPAHWQDLAASLEDRLSDQGFDAQSTHETLAALLAVQNTYLSTFQSLGALGLLLGTFGLATVQLRNVLERRKELALMQAAGFRRPRLADMVMRENGFLLVVGLAIGLLAALVAVLPHWWSGGASAPFATLAAMLFVVLVVGMLSAIAAAQAVMKAPVVAALRGE